MDFVPASRLIVNDLLRNGEEEVAEALLSLAARAQAIVPELVGVSVGHNRSGTVFTLAASSIEAATIDATQYIAGGPCVDASTGGNIEAWELPADSGDLMDEQRWATYARASAAEGVASSLSLPLLARGRIVGGVNLYASTSDAFEGRHDALALALGSDVTLVVANADLSFATRELAQQTADDLAADDLVHQATGIIAERHDVDMNTARGQLATSARRAGVTEVQAATVLIRALGE